MVIEMKYLTMISCLLWGFNLNDYVCFIRPGDPVTSQVQGKQGRPTPDDLVCIAYSKYEGKDDMVSTANLFWGRSIRAYVFGSRGYRILVLRDDRIKALKLLALWKEKNSAAFERVKLVTGLD